MSILDELNKMASPFLNPSGTANALQRAIDKQAEAMRAGANPTNSPSMAVGGSLYQASPLDLLQQQLNQQLAQIPDYTTPTDQLRQQAEAQMNSQYDPLIQALQQQIQQTTSRATKNEGQAKDMYNSLAQGLAADIPQITQQAKAAQDETSNRYSQASQQLQNEYKTQANDQQDVLQRLGIQAAAPEANQQASTDQAYFQQQNDLSKQQALDAQQQQQASATNYQQNLSDTSRQAGLNTAQDIASQLEDYLQGANSQLGGLQAQRSSGIEALLGQLQSG